MKRRTILSIILLSIVTLGVLITREENLSRSSASLSQKEVKGEKSSPAPTVKPVPVAYEIPHKKQVFQTYNNCGPASLSMALSYWGVDVSQEELGKKLRPYQVRSGNNDDKSVTFNEFVNEVPHYNLTAYHRPNGSIDLLKKLVANNFPVLVRTWLHPNEDIGHFRLVRGYDDLTQEIIQDDSYEGKNLRYSYQQFSEMWQPFNYEYIVLTSKDRASEVEAILGEDVSEKTAWENARKRAQKEPLQEGRIPYSLFNQAVASYHLGDYEETVLIYEQIKRQLPSRMLWYQIEPIQALAKTGRHDEALELINNILSRNNLAFTELHLIKGDIYKAQGNRDLARASYEKAVFYNVNNVDAKNALNSL